MEQVWQAVWKSLIIFVLLIILSRVIGRKLLSQMSFFDFVTAITIGTISGAYVVTTIKGLAVLVSPVVLTLATVAVGYLTLTNLRFRKLIEGEPVVVIQNGQIMEKNMKRLRYHLDDLEMQLRVNKIFNLGEVEFAVLEPHGQLSVLKKSQYATVTPKDLGLSTQYKGLASEIIKDGQLLEKNLIENHLSREWLSQELQKLNINDMSDVFCAALNTDGTLYVDQYRDVLPYVQEVED